MLHGREARLDAKRHLTQGTERAPARRTSPRYDAVGSTARRLHHSYEEYLAALEVSGVELEYCDGEIYALAGGTSTHADVAASMTRLLGNALLGRCRVSSSDLTVRIEGTDLSTSPDVSVVCGERRVSTIDTNAVVNPTLLVEVTSRSTEDYDRGEKLANDKQIDGLRAVLLVSHRRQQITVVERLDGRWREREVRTGESLVLSDPHLEIALDEVYEDIDLETRSR